MILKTGTELQLNIEVLSSVKNIHKLILLTIIHNFFL